MYMNIERPEQLYESINKYNPECLDEVQKAYSLAEEFHRGQKRQSGEDYIIHPLNVAYILSELHGL